MVGKFYRLLLSLHRFDIGITVAFSTKEGNVLASQIVLKILHNIVWMD